MKWLPRLWAGLVVGSIEGCNAPYVTVTTNDAAAETPPTATTETLTVETWDVVLKWRYLDPTVPTRLQNVADALSTDEEVDVECLQGLTDDEDRQALVERLKARFPYVGYVRVDRTTPIDDAHDLTGELRTVDMTAACKDPLDIARVDARLACIRDRCRGADGYVERGCAESACGELAQPESLRCLYCSYGWLDQAFDTVRDTCVSQPRGELQKDGRLGALILSRHPLTNVRAHVFPASLEQRGALSATVTVGTRAVSVLCVSVGQLYAERYAGVFGAPDEAELGQSNEVELAVVRVMEVGNALGATRPTILLGGPYAQWSLMRSGEPTEPTPWLRWATNFAPIVTPGKDLCTLCRTNPLGKLMQYITGSASFFDALLFTSGSPLPVMSFGISRTEQVYTVLTKAVPASPWHGVRARLALP
jgi:hypothetical protein